MNVPLLRKYGFAAIASAAAITLSSPVARAETVSMDGINLGDAGGMGGGEAWALFTFGQTLGDTDIFSGSPIEGYVGAAGTGRASLSGGSEVDGVVYYHTTGSVTTSGGSTITGGKVSSSTVDSFLGQGVTDAMSASAAATGLLMASDAQTPSTNLPSLSLTAIGTPNDRYILQISNFTLSNQTLFLHGDANSSFVFDITTSFQIAYSHIVLVGVSANNVIFNYTGSAPIQLNDASLSGIILAADPSNYKTSSVQVSNNSSITGEIVADKVSLTGNSLVQGIVSP